jgi:hypothetical protein
VIVAVGPLEAGAGAALEPELVATTVPAAAIAATAPIAAIQRVLCLPCLEVIADHPPVAKLLGNRWAQACSACWNWGEALLIDAAAAGLIRPSGPGSGTGIK